MSLISGAQTWIWKDLDRAINLSDYLRGKLFKCTCITTEIDLLFLSCLSPIAVELVIVDNSRLVSGLFNCNSL